MGKEILVKHKLKITPQRIAVLEALDNIKGHPTADSIIEYVRRNHPNIAIGTVYNALDTFVSKGILRKVKTERDIMYYDSITENHHHLYCSDSERIEDYFDDELNTMLQEYFAKKSIPNFKVEDVKLQITGKFTG